MINIGEKVAAAREARGFKQFELARRASVAPAQLCKVENGRVNPSFTLVERIATALDLTIPELLYDEKRKPVEEPAEEDSRSGLSLKKRFVPIRFMEPDAAKALKVIQAEMKTEVTPPMCTLAVNKAYFRYEGAGAALAEELRGDLGLGTAPLGDLKSVLWFRGITVVEARLSKEGYGSVSFWDTVRGAPVIVLSTLVTTAEHRLYRLAYELGSAALYASLGVRLGESLDQHRFLTDFTSAFLLPGVSVCTCVSAVAVGPEDWTFDNVLPLKSYFGVSAEMFVLRLEELGLIRPKLRLALRDQFRAYYKAHPDDMEPRLGFGA